MNEKIKEVQQYFKSKILNHQFSILDTTEFVLKIEIDKQYVFNIWVGNFDIPHLRYIYEGSFMMLEFNKKESIKIHSILKENYTAFQKDVLFETKKQKFEKLKKELGY